MTAEEYRQNSNVNSVHSWRGDSFKFPNIAVWNMLSHNFDGLPMFAHAAISLGK